MEGKIAKRPLSRKISNSSIKTCDPVCASPQPATKVVSKRTGSLEIIEGDASGLYSPTPGPVENGSRPPSQGFPRPWSRSSVGSVPPRPDSSTNRRLPTPTKHITLQTVKRKEESYEPFEPEVDLQHLSLDKSYNRAWDFTLSEEDPYQIETSNLKSKFAETDTTPTKQSHSSSQQKSDTRGHDSHRQDVEYTADVSSETKSKHQAAAHNGEGDFTAESADLRAANDLAAASTEQDSEDDEGEDGDESSEEEERRAPNELLMEFVECLMKKDYKNADKLCKMILLYEPSNPEALKFQPVIEEKLRLDEEEEEEDDDDEGDNDDDDEGEDSSSGDENDDSESDVDDEEDSDSDEDDPSVFRLMAEAVASNYYQNNEEPTPETSST